MAGKEIHIPASKFVEAIKKRLEEDTELLRLAAWETAARATHECVREADAAGLVDQGHYRMAFDFGPLPDGAIFGNNAPHAAVIEYGRRPGKMPPVQPILEWVRRKGIQPRDLGTLDHIGNFFRRLTGRRQKRKVTDEKAIAFLIARAIGRRGTKPKLIMFRVRRKVGRWLVDAAVRQLRRKSRQGG